MKSINSSLVLFLTLLICFLSNTQQNKNINILSWKVDGINREAMVYIPPMAISESTPILFVFHGHGENMQQMFERYNFVNLWPEAIIVAPQGLKTPGKLIDKDGKYSGWQQGVGFEGDRDIFFFDTILNSLEKEYKIDKKQIFVTGHSNGGSFTYLLWAMRADKIAAFAPSAAVIGDNLDLLKPKPVMHIMGKNDPLVKPAWQKMTINQLKKINHCSLKGKTVSKYSTLYPSLLKTPVVVYAHSEQHIYPKEACSEVVLFFKKIGSRVTL